MHRVFALVIVIAVLFSAAPAHVQTASARPQGAHNDAQHAAQKDQLEKQLRDADLEFAKQTHERRLEGWMDFFADDASVIHEGKVTSGKTALRAFYEPVFANQDFTLTWTPTKAEASKDGSLGYTFGDYEARNAGQTSRGVYATTWRRVNGRWKVVLDLGNAQR
jgi:ketosteroid isomerase-like protein